MEGEISHMKYGAKGDWGWIPGGEGPSKGHARGAEGGRRAAEVGLCRAAVPGPGARLSRQPPLMKRSRRSSFQVHCSPHTGPAEGRPNATPVACPQHKRPSTDKCPCSPASVSTTTAGPQPPGRQRHLWVLGERKAVGVGGMGEDLLGSSGLGGGGQALVLSW